MDYEISDQWCGLILTHKNKHPNCHSLAFYPFQKSIHFDQSAHHASLFSLFVRLKNSLMQYGFMEWPIKGWLDQLKFLFKDDCITSDISPNVWKGKITFHVPDSYHNPFVQLDCSWSSLEDYIKTKQMVFDSKIVSDVWKSHYQTIDVSI